MPLIEDDELTPMELFRKEGIAECYAEGYTEGVLEAYTGLVRDGLLSVGVAASRLGLTDDRIMDALRALDYTTSQT